MSGIMPRPIEKNEEEDKEKTNAGAGSSRNESYIGAIQAGSYVASFIGDSEANETFLKIKSKYGNGELRKKNLEPLVKEAIDRASSGNQEPILIEGKQGEKSLEIYYDISDHRIHAKAVNII